MKANVIKLKENEKNTLRRELDAKETRRAHLLEAVSEGRGVVKGSLTDIPERIVQMERRILDCEREWYRLRRRESSSRAETNARYAAILSRVRSAR